jgi:hypothetical protein
MNNPSPARACGIDFGTSNSTVGWIRPGEETLIALEDDKITLPSVVFFNFEERRPVYGRLALHEYLENYEGRLMRSLKSLLGSKLIKHDTSVLGTAMPFTDLLALFIGQLKSRAEANAGREFEEVVLGRPVFFVDDDPMADQEAENTLVDVARKIGFKDISFQYEPIAAAFDYESTIQKEELVLIVDIGGGTSDFSLVRLSPDRRHNDNRQSDILATGGVHIGGTDFDKQLSLNGMMPLFGYGSRMKSGAYALRHRRHRRHRPPVQVDRTARRALVGHGSGRNQDPTDPRRQPPRRAGPHRTRPERRPEPRTVRVVHRYLAGACARQRDAVAQRRFGERGAGGHGVLYRRFQRDSGTAPQHLGDVAEGAACGRQYLWQYRQWSGD